MAKVSMHDLMFAAFPKANCLPFGKGCVVTEPLPEGTGGPLVGYVDPSNVTNVVKRVMWLLSCMYDYSRTSCQESIPTASSAGDVFVSARVAADYLDKWFPDTLHPSDVLSERASCGFEGVSFTELVASLIGMVDMRAAYRKYVLGDVAYDAPGPVMSMKTVQAVATLGWLSKFGHGVDTEDELRAKFASNPSSEFEFDEASTLDVCRAVDAVFGATAGDNGFESSSYTNGRIPHTRVSSYKCNLVCGSSVATVTLSKSKPSVREMNELSAVAVAMYASDVASGVEKPRLRTAKAVNVTTGTVTSVDVAGSPIDEAAFGRMCSFLGIGDDLVKDIKSAFNLVGPSDSVASTETSGFAKVGSKERTRPTLPEPMPGSAETLASCISGIAGITGRRPYSLFDDMVGDVLSTADFDKATVDDGFKVKLDDQPGTGHSSLVESMYLMDVAVHDLGMSTVEAFDTIFDGAVMVGNMDARSRYSDIDEGLWDEVVETIGGLRDDISKLAYGKFGTVADEVRFLDIMSKACLVSDHVSGRGMWGSLESAVASHVVPDETLRNAMPRMVARMRSLVGGSVHYYGLDDHADTCVSALNRIYADDPMLRPVEFSAGGVAFATSMSGWWKYLSPHYAVPSRAVSAAAAGFAGYAVLNPVRGEASVVSSECAFAEWTSSLFGHGARP